jgi:hypothetical protein
MLTCDIPISVCQWACMHAHLMSACLNVCTSRYLFESTSTCRGLAYLQCINKSRTRMSTCMHHCMYVTCACMSLYVYNTSILVCRHAIYRYWYVSGHACMHVSCQHVWMYARLDICLNLHQHVADSHICDVSISHRLTCRHACIIVCMLHVHVCLCMSTAHRYWYVDMRYTDIGISMGMHACTSHVSMSECMHVSIFVWIYVDMLRTHMFVMHQ